MAFALLTSALVTGSTGGTTSAVNTTGAKLFVANTTRTAGTPTVTDSGGNIWVALPTRAEVVTSGVNSGVQQWYCLNPTTVGAGHTFTFSAAGADIFGWMSVLVFSADADVTFRQNVALPTPTPSITPSGDNQLIVGDALNLFADNISVSGLTLVHMSGDVGGVNMGGGSAYIVQTTAAPAAITWSDTGGWPAWATSTTTFAAAPSISDNFDRADSTGLGSNWSSGGTGDINVYSNQARSTSGFVAYVSHVTETATTACRNGITRYTTVDDTHVMGDTEMHICSDGVVANYPFMNGYMVLMGGGGVANIRRDSVVVTSDASTAFQPNSGPHFLELSHDGAGVVKFYVDGVEVLSYTDPTPLTNKKHGFGWGHVSFAGAFAYADNYTAVDLGGPAGPTYSETGRSVGITATVTCTDVVALPHYTELEWNLKLQAPAANADVYEFRVQVGNSLLATYAVTPQLTASIVGGGGVNYNETGKSIPITATVTETDQVDYKSNVGLAVPVTATVTVLEQVDYKSNTALPVPIVGDVTQPTNLLKRFETALLVPIVGAVTTIDQADWKSNTALSVPVIADVTATSLHKRQELGLSIPVVSDITRTDQADFKQPAALTTVDVTATITVLDVQVGVSPKIATLVDSFDSSIDTGVWKDTSAAVVWDAGRVKIPCTTDYWALQTGLYTGQVYDFVFSGIYAKVTVPPVGSGSRATIFSIYKQGVSPYNDKVWMSCDGAFLTAYTTVAGVDTAVGFVAYNPTTHAWWRMRDDGEATTFFYTSPSGAPGTWMTLTSTDTPAWANRVALGFTSGYWGTETAADAYIDNVNVPGAAAYNETGRPLNIFADITATDQADFKEPLLSVPVVATFTAPTQAFTHFGSYSETGLPIPIIGAVTAPTEQVDYKSNVGLSVPVVGTVTIPTDKRKTFETALSVPVTAAVTMPVNQADFKETTPPLSVPIVATIDRTDNQSSPGHFDETNKSIDIGASLSLPTQQADFKNPGLSVPVVADVTTVASKGYHDAGLLSVGITATVTITALVKLREPVSFPVTAEVTSTSQADFKEAPVAVPLVAEITVLDLVHRLGEVLKVDVVVSVTLTDQCDFHDLTRSVPVLAEVNGTSLLHIVPLLLAFSIVATITRTDKKGSTLITVLGDADVLYLGDEIVDRVYAGAIQAWP